MEIRPFLNRRGITGIILYYLGLFAAIITARFETIPQFWYWFIILTCLTLMLVIEIISYQRPMNKHDKTFAQKIVNVFERDGFVEFLESQNFGTSFRCSLLKPLKSISYFRDTQDYFIDTALNKMWKDITNNIQEFDVLVSQHLYPADHGICKFSENIDDKTVSKISGEINARAARIHDQYIGLRRMLNEMWMIGKSST